MKRLTYDFELGGEHCWQVEGADNLVCRDVCERQENDSGCKSCPIARAFDRLAAIEDILGDEYDLDELLELVQAKRDGRCVALPCKVGDSVYFITGIHGKIVKDAKVEEIYFGESVFALGVSTGFTTFTIQQNEVFFTKEAAESALKGEQDERM